MKRDNLFVRFERAITGMVIPDQRKVGNLPNAMWFLRNGMIRNSHHPRYTQAMDVAREISRFL